MGSNDQPLRGREEQPSTDTSSANHDVSMNYRSFSDSHEGRLSSSPNYRGFSTSINDMFISTANERVDCCALACCGVLQSDRDRFLLTGVKPPSCFKRFWIHIVLPIVLFFVACYCAMKIGHPYLNSVLSTAFVFSLIGYFVIQCFKGTLKRRQVRKELLWSKHQMLQSGDGQEQNDDHYEDSSQEEASERLPAYLMGQTLADLRRSHAPFACYASDRMNEDAADDGDKDTICTRMFQCFTTSCCGKLCGMHLQLCGVCAIAQEAREVERMIDSGYRHIDYITMQPMLEYYPAIYDARNNEESSSTWLECLSTFSKNMLSGCLGFVVLLFGWSFLSAYLGHKFGPANFAVFCATIFQALFLLVLVLWKHTKDISIDAVIKLFACGFCLSTTLAVGFELVTGIMLRITMSLLIAMSGVDVVQDNGYSFALQLTMPGFGDGWLEARESGNGSESYREYLGAFGRDHPFAYTLYLLVRSFILAALIEELSKYFGYRMVEHPDFLSKRELEDTAANYYDDENEEGRQTQDAPSFSQQDRSKQSRAAAVTVAMVVVSIGFACCENLVYIFIYAETTVATELIVLLARSLFPVHPIAAAIQSIGVVERDVENMLKKRLGQIILPSVLLHGGYDFFLMWIDYWVKRKGNFVAGDDETEDSGFTSMLVSIFVLAGGICYYIRESKKQRKRLASMDQAISVDQSRLI